MKFHYLEGGQNFLWSLRCSPYVWFTTLFARKGILNLLPSMEHTF